MSASSPDSSGFGAQLRALGDRLLAGVHGRIGLVSIELQEEKFRLIQIFIWISAVVFVAMMSIAFASITLVYAVAESARLAVLCILTSLYAIAFACTAIAFHRFLARQPKPFADTLDEIGKDRACIQTGS